MPTTAEVYVYLDRFANHSDRLQVGEIRIASPGLMNLLGIPQVIKQLRLFIKDLSYRNKLERRRGELKLVKQQIEIHEMLQGLAEGSRNELIKKLGPVVRSFNSNKVSLLTSGEDD